MRAEAKSVYMMQVMSVSMAVVQDMSAVLGMREAMYDCMIRCNLSSLCAETL